ncbi:MAG: PhnD/SsuA/transferrin family substrate-binding protein, partial [Myxococcota bacterium]
QPHYVGTHSNVYRHVILGRAAAGGGVPQTLEQEPQDLQGALRIIYTTPGWPSHPLCSHPRLSETVRERITQTLLAFSSEDEGRALLARAGLATVVRADYARDYEAIEALGLDNITTMSGP